MDALLSVLIKSCGDDSMDVQTVCGAAPHPLLWAGSRSARVRVAVTGTPTLTYLLCDFYSVHILQM